MKKWLWAVMVVMLVFAAVPRMSALAESTTVPGFPEVYPSEEVTGYLTAEGMTVMVFPLNKDFFYGYFSNYQTRTPAEVRTYRISGVELGYKNLYLAPDPDDPTGFVRYTVLYHTTGSKLIAIGIYDRGELDEKGKYVPSKSYYSSDVRTGPDNPDTEHSVLGDFYPNKILNDLEAAQAILDYQAENGPFVAGQEYSMLTILNFRGRDGYVLGKTSSGSLVTGGGICVIVTNWMKMLSLSGAKIIEKWEHPDGQKYFENPFGTAELPTAATDATVEWPKYDLRWVQKETGWVTVSAVVMPDGDELGSEYGEEIIKYDALEIITLRFTTTKPNLSTTSLEALQRAYGDYREGKAGLASLTPEKSVMIVREPWKQGDAWSTLLSQVAPQERISRFAYELTHDPFLMSLVSLRLYANRVDPTSDTKMGKYLTKTPWYAQEMARLEDDPSRKLRIDLALEHLDQYSNVWPNQKVQCVGLTVLVSAMDERFPNIGGVSFNYAAELVPDSIRTGYLTTAVGNGMIIKAVTSIDDVRVGDLGVRYDTKTGHVFAVVGKKTFEGQTVLLIAAANQASDGLISLFEVDKSNFDAVFGVPDVKKVVLRSGKN